MVILNVYASRFSECLVGAVTYNCEVFSIMQNMNKVQVPNRSLVMQHSYRSPSKYWNLTKNLQSTVVLLVLN